MPYFLHPSSTPAPESADDALLRGLPSFPAREDAYAARAVAEAVTYLPSAEETHVWRTRECNRFYNGKYRAVPWANKLNDSMYAAHHRYAHLSLTHPGQIAYTPDNESGHRDRQITINPGRYLARFYPELSQVERERWIAACRPATAEDIRFATSADEIERVYRGRGYDSAPFHSCMGPDAHASFDVHPSRVYGESDLAVAYLGEIDAVKARAVVFPKEKTFARCYGVEALRVGLETLGFTEGDPTGARIRAIPHNGGWLMPYVDGCEMAEEVRDDCGNVTHFRLSDDGPINTQTTCGYTSRMITITCDHCDSAYETCSSDDDDTHLCPTCSAARFTCGACDETFYEGQQYGYQVGYHYHQIPFCASCYAEHEHTCERCAETFSPLAHRGEDRARIDMQRGSHCLTCINALISCHACATLREPDVAACVCGIPERCKDTPDMLGEVPDDEFIWTSPVALAYYRNRYAAPRLLAYPGIASDWAQGVPPEITDADLDSLNADDSVTVTAPSITAPLPWESPASIFDSATRYQRLFISALTDTTAVSMTTGN